VDAVGIRARGIRAAQERLERLADRIAGATEEAISEFADDVVVHMKGVVPVDTGRLRDSISKEADGMHVTVGPRGVEYASYVEYGTSRSPAQPYVRPTIQWVRANGPARIARRIEGVIQE
jgi:HK97 gp10 family phage protein